MSAIAPIIMQNFHKLIFCAILSSMLIERIPAIKEKRQPIVISQNWKVGNPPVRPKPISAARIAGTLMMNERVSADSLLNSLKIKNERVSPDREIPGNAENP